MRSLVTQSSALLGLLFAGTVGSVNTDWVFALPGCWQDCLSSSGTSCSSSKCICEASQDSSYLTSAVSCDAAQCDSDTISIGFNFLSPLATFCVAEGNDIPEPILSSAYDAITATATSSSSTSRISSSHISSRTVAVTDASSAIMTTASSAAVSSQAPPATPSSTQSSIATSTAHATQKGGSNGSPFDNMQAGAAGFIVSNIFVGLGVGTVILAQL